VSQIYGRKDPQIRTKSAQTSASTCLMIKFEYFLNAASMCWCDKKHCFDNKGSTQCAIFLPAVEQYNGHHDWKLLETLPLINKHTKLPVNKRLLVQTLDSNVGNVCCGFSLHWRHYMILNEQHNLLVRYQYSEVCGHDLQRCTQEEIDIDIETTILGKLQYCSWQRGIGGIADTNGATTHQPSTKQRTKHGKSKGNSKMLNRFICRKYLNANGTSRQVTSSFQCATCNMLLCSRLV